MMVWEIISVNRGNWIYIFAVLATLLSWVERGGICLCSVQGSALQSQEESTVLPLVLFCLLSVQCAGRPEQLRWYGDGVLASVPIWAVCLCAVQRGARGRLTTRQHPRLDPGHDQEPASLGAPPLPLPAPPSCTGCKVEPAQRLIALSELLHLPLLIST